MSQNLDPERVVIDRKAQLSSVAEEKVATLTHQVIRHFRLDPMSMNYQPS
jgi:hypothetical protein